MAALQNMCAEVYMIPEYGDYNLYRKKRALFGNNIWAKLDVVIPVLHGSNGEDGIFEGILESIGIPYAGCNTLSSANGMGQDNHEDDYGKERDPHRRLRMVHRQTMVRPNAISSSRKSRPDWDIPSS